MLPTKRPAAAPATIAASTPSGCARTSPSPRSDDHEPSSDRGEGDVRRRDARERHLLLDQMTARGLGVPKLRTTHLDLSAAQQGGQELVQGDIEVDRR